MNTSVLLSRIFFCFCHCFVCVFLSVLLSSIVVYLCTFEAPCCLQYIPLMGLCRSNKLCDNLQTSSRLGQMMLQSCKLPQRRYLPFKGTVSQDCEPLVFPAIKSSWAQNIWLSINIIIKEKKNQTIIKLAQRNMCDII